MNPTPTLPEANHPTGSPERADLRPESINDAVIRLAGDSQDGIQSAGAFLARLAGRSAQDVMTYMAPLPEKIWQNNQKRQACPEPEPFASQLSPQRAGKDAHGEARDQKRHGTVNAAWMRNDTDLASLRGDARFQALLKQLEEKGAATGA